MTFDFSLSALASARGLVRAVAVASVVVGGALGLSSALAQSSSSIAVAGYLEHAWLGNGAFRIKAKLDTGATSSSINSANAEFYEKDGKRWVRLDLTNRENESWRVHLPIKREITIRRAGTAKEARPVVDLEVCVGGKTGTSEFTLANRTGQSYQILIGRKFMKDRLYVDSGKEYLLNHRCEKG